MKKFSFILCFILLTLACEDVIEVELPTTEPRLIIEALMRVDINEEFIPVEVKVTETDNFFGDVPVTSLENILIVITLTDSLGIESSGISTLAESEPGTGVYIPDPNFSTDQRIPTSAVAFDLRYDLIIEHKGRKHIAQTKYIPSAPIIKLEQGDGTLFGDDETEITIGFHDEAIDNYYIFDYDNNEYLVSEDKFYQGQEFEFTNSLDREIEPGTTINVSILGADKTFYEYMSQLLEQSEESQGPFQTPTATVRGNVFDITDLDNRIVFDNVEQPNVFPLGYFAIVEEQKASITIQ